jgi:cysteinyl-tRNA synthetase
MSKKLGNFYTLRDLIEKGFTGREARYALLTVNYRLPLNFTLPGLESARASLARIDEWVDRLTTHSTGASPVATALSDFTEKFFVALDEDLNISGALAPLFDLIRESNSALNRGELSPAQAAQLLADWRRIDSVLGFEREAAAVPAEVLALVEQRQRARANKEWKKSDELRDEILATGWVVKDTKDGPKLTPR